MKELKAFKEFLQEENKPSLEKMYSEEEIVKILLARNVELGIIERTSEVIEWFQQYKKK
jgi:hypothetical protein